MRFLEGWPSIMVERPSPTIVVSDIHYGFEAELNEKGVRVPSQTEKITSLLVSLADETGAERIVILGDLKHNVPSLSRIEWNELPRAIQKLREKGLEVVLVPGNHDGGIVRILGDLVELASSSGLLLKGEKKFFMFHGHRWPGAGIMEADVVFMGHLHPTVSIKTDLGSVVRRPVWLIMEGDKRVLARIFRERFNVSLRGRGRIRLVVFPSFNPMVTGISVNSLLPNERLWPLIRTGAFQLEDAEAVLLEGVSLGRVRDLERAVEE